MTISRLLLAAALVLCTSIAALAHDSPPRLELNADRLNPGGPLEVRGINLGADLPIAVALIGAGVEVQRQNGGDMHPAQVEAALRASADDLGKPGNDDFYGAGRVKAGNAVP